MFTDWRRAGALYTSGMKRVYLVRGARPSAEYSVAVPAGTGHLESTAPFRLRTEEGETFASGRASGRHVVVLPVSRVDRAATILPGLEIDIADRVAGEWLRVLSGRRSARGRCLGQT